MLTEYDSVEFNKRLMNYASLKGVILSVDISPKTLSARYTIKKGELVTSYTLDYDLRIDFEQVVYDKLNDAIQLLDQVSSQQLHAP